MKRRQPVRTMPRVLQPAELGSIKGGLPLIRELINRIESGGYYEVRMEDVQVSSYQ
jgi:hypothetical protein